MTRPQPTPSAKPPQHLQKRRDPHQDRSREAVDRILHAAAELLSEHGVEKLTTRSIAKLAGVNVSTLYQFFPNKHAIIYALYKNWDTAGRAVFTSADRKLPHSDDWRTFFMDFLNNYEDIGFSAKLESRLMQAVSVYADLRVLEQDYLFCARAKLVDYVRHFAPSCPVDRATAMASLILEWDIALADQEVAHKGPVHELILEMTYDGLLHLLGTCIEGPNA